MKKCPLCGRDLYITRYEDFWIEYCEFCKYYAVHKIKCLSTHGCLPRINLEKDCPLTMFVPIKKAP
jgi:uncharacterized protein YutD